jgi:hypothetical protein
LPIGKSYSEEAKKKHSEVYEKMIGKNKKALQELEDKL